MSNKPGRSKREQTHEQPSKWGDPISLERQAELHGYLDRWEAETDHSVRTGPFVGVQLTGADASWLAVQSGRDTVGAVPNLHLEGANLRGASLERAFLYKAHLENAFLGGAHIEGANLRAAHLEGANLRAVHLEGAFLYDAHLEGIYLGAAYLEGANLRAAHLEGANLGEAHLEGAFLYDAHLEGIYLGAAYLEGANLGGTYLERADLRAAHLEGKTFPANDPDLLRIQQWKADFPAVLLPADLRGAFFDDATQLSGTTVFAGNETAMDKAEAVTVADLRWRGANLAVVRLPPAHLLGDEHIALTPNDDNGKPKDRDTQIAQFQAAVRANRQLAVALKAQGLDEDAGRFAYNAHLLQQQVLLRQRKFGAYIFSRFLDGLAGYGYKPVRSLIAYLVLVLGFAVAYYSLGQTTGPHLQWYEAIVVSLTAFHGRGFFSQQFSPGAPQSVLAAAEAVVGLLIEISFIATFTQRFFGAS